MLPLSIVSAVLFVLLIVDFLSMEWRTSLPNYWYDLVILDFTNGSKSEERIVVEAGSEDEAYDDLCFYLDNVYPEDEFEVDVYPYYDDEENENA